MQLVKRRTTQSNYLVEQEIESLYLCTKNLDNNTNSNIYKSCIFKREYNCNFLAKQLKYCSTYKDLPGQIAKKISFTVARNRLKFLIALYSVESNFRYRIKYKLSKYNYWKISRYCLFSKADRDSHLTMTIKSGAVNLSPINMIKTPNYLNLNNYHQTAIASLSGHDVVEVNKNQDLDQDCQKDRMILIDKLVTLMISPQIKHRIKKLAMKNSSYKWYDSKLWEENYQNLSLKNLVIFVEKLMYESKSWGGKVFCKDFYTSVVSCGDQNQNLVPNLMSRYGRMGTDWNQLSNEKTRTKNAKLYKLDYPLLIGADINDSLNILIKVFTKALSQGIQGAVVRPVGVIPCEQTARDRYSCRLKL